MASVKRRALPLETKLDVINALEWGETKAAVSKRFNLIYSTVNSIWCSRDRVKAAAVGGLSHTAKKMRKPTNEDLDKALLDWFLQRQLRQLPVNGPLLQSQADEIALSLGIRNFHCSLGWIDRFKIRHAISFGNGRSHGEASSEANRSFEDDVLPTVAEARECVRKLSQFYECTGDEQILRHLSQIDDDLQCKEAKISDFLT